MGKYIINLSRVEYQSATVEVEAESEEEAANAAMDMATFHCNDADQQIETIEPIEPIEPAP